METLLEIIYQDTLISDALSCYSQTDLEYYLSTYSTFRLHLISQRDSDRSVVLATTHFLKLHSEVSRNMTAMTARQVTKGTKIEPISTNLILSQYGSNHWLLSSFGIEYQQLQQCGNVYSAIGFGI
jgi:hypothetical protein